jgi:RHS repeat-associated protein
MYLGTDVQGSVRSATVDTGLVEERYEYDAFGTPYQGDLSSGMNLGYTGKPYDPATGLYNYGYRDYQPAVARFTTVDPVRDGNNWFAYVNNDPVNWIDPWGLSANDKNWIDNGNGTYTAKQGATLYDLYGNDWQEKSGFTRDPTTLQIGETVGVPNRSSAPSTPQNQPAGSPAAQNTAPATGGTSPASQVMLPQYEPTQSNLVDITKSWAEKKPGELLTDQEANLQITIGGMFIGGGLVGGFLLTVAFENPAPLYFGLYFAADGTALIGDGLQNRKRTPTSLAAMALIPWYLPSPKY